MVAFTYSLIYHSDRFGYKPLRIPSACERFQVEKTVSMDGDDLATLGASAFLPLPALAVFYLRGLTIRTAEGRRFRYYEGCDAP
jgi:hypothetical protein